MKKQKKVLLITVLCMVTLMGVVYATFTALTLKVNTTATASASIFRFGFDDIEPNIEKNNDNITVNAITPKEGDLEVTLSASGLKKIGDKASVYYTIVNNGDVDATDIQIYVGPDRQLEPGDSPQVWISDDGVFEFAAYPNAGGEYTDNYWTLNTPLTLKVGEKGRINFEVTLLKAVESETTASCTAKITGNPAGE